jgi:hypothetical protein
VEAVPRNQRATFLGSVDSISVPYDMPEGPEERIDVAAMAELLAYLSSVK